MANGILGTGVTGLLAFQRSLATISHNISNVNTEGYTRQRVDLTSQDAQAFGFGSIGNGVKVDGIVRLYDEMLTQQLRGSTSSFNQVNEFNSLITQVDNLLADPDTGITTALDGFFNAIQGVADDPASIPARQVLISEAETLAIRFNSIDQRFLDLRNGVDTRMRTAVTEINDITKAIASINGDIANLLTIASGQPNDLLDQRDLLLKQLAERISVTTVDQSDGSINVFVGNGQTVVAGFSSSNLSLVQNSYDPLRMEIGYVAGSTTINITNELSGGMLGGEIEFRNQVLDTAQNALGQLAIGLADTFNTQHRLGLDLNGVLGGDFFAPIDATAPVVLTNTGNTGSPAAVINTVIADPSLLTASDYRLERNGTVYTLTRLSDNTVFNLTTFPGGAETVDGLTLSLSSGAIASGDRFLIKPAKNGARDFSVLINNTSNIAAAVPVRTGTSLSNTGTATIDAGVVFDTAAYVSDSYNIILADNSSAVADGGATRGAITDNNADSTLQYELRINGTLIYTQNEAAAPLADLDALALAINGVADANVAQTGVKAYVDNTSTTLYMANVPPTSLPITVTETLNTTAGTVEDGDTVTGYFGTALTGVTTPTGAINYTAAADSYIVIDSSNNTEASGAYVAGGQISFNGIRTSINGLVNLGDTYTVVANAGGVSDNRNALTLSSLQTQLNLNQGTTSFGGAYSQIVVDIGIKARQADVNLQAQQGILNQITEARESKSGVNLDEEAAELIRFQQAYQAAAQIIAAANSIFETLLRMVSR